MKLLATALFTLSAFAGLSVAGSNDDKTNIKICRKTNPDILAAIDAFCNKPGGDTMMVPSEYAKAGKIVGKAHVWIKGDCKPAQWLPKRWCLSQFHEVCGFTTFGGGYGRVDKGRNGCQKFIIEKVKK